MNTLVLVAHDHIEKSRINHKLAEAIKSLDGVLVRVLVPGFDILHEQEELLKADRIVLQFPLQWFSTPAILKQWIDQVLSWGFAYGDAYKLAGKKIKFVVSTGGTAESYTLAGEKQHTVDDFLLPLKATAEYVKLEVEPGFYVHNVFQLDEAQLNEYAEQYKSELSK